MKGKVEAEATHRPGGFVGDERLEAEGQQPLQEQQPHSDPAAASGTATGTGFGNGGGGRAAEQAKEAAAKGARPTRNDLRDNRRRLGCVVRDSHLMAPSGNKGGGDEFTQLGYHHFSKNVF